MDACKPHMIACTCILGRSDGGNMVWVPVAAAWQPPDAAGPSAACTPSGLPARSAQQAAPLPRELTLERVRQAQKLACTYARLGSASPAMVMQALQTVAR